MSNDKADSLDDVIATVDELIAWYGAAIPFDAVIALRVRLAALQVHCKLNASPPISGAAVPDELLWEPGDLPERDDYREGWNDCRAAMLADQPAKGGAQPETSASDAQQCPWCFSCDCNGECGGDDMMGDS